MNREIAAFVLGALAIGGFLGLFAYMIWSSSSLERGRVSIECLKTGGEWVAGECRRKR